MADEGTLYKKYRPKDFSELFGNRTVVESLELELSKEFGMTRAFLFVGPSGCGKTTMARIIKTKLNCSDLDFSEFNTANTRGIDTIREISNNCSYAPRMGRIRIYLMDECHKLTNDAQNALLKLLEDTPDHVVFILCTTEPERLIKTVHTRCTHYTMALLTSTEMFSLLTNVCKKEGVAVDNEVLKAIMNVAAGCPRQALVLLDKVIGVTDKNTALKMLTTSTTEQEKVIDLCRAVLYGKGNVWQTVVDLLKNLETDDWERVRRAILGYMTSVLLSERGDYRVAQIIDTFSRPYYDVGKSGLVRDLYYAVSLK